MKDEEVMAPEETEELMMPMAPTGTSSEDTSSMGSLCCPGTTGTISAVTAIIK